MKCKKCRKEVPDGAAFCPWCGAELRDKAEKPARKTRTRGNGLGSVYKRGGKWMAVKVIGWTVGPDGKARKQTRSKGGFATKREALEYLPKISMEARKPVETWAEVYDAWLPTHQATQATLDCYKAAERWFTSVHRMKMADITVDHLQDALDNCPKGRRTQENMRSLAGLLYKYAIPRGIASLNMAQYLTIHAKNDGGKEPLPDSALDALKAHLHDVPGADYVLCHCYLGFRPSELLELRAENYNREERAFRGGAKTRAGKNRTVTVPPVIQPIVDRLLKDKIAGPVFCRADGSKMSIYVYRELFYKVLDACGIENPTETDSNGQERKRYTPHSCRHTFAMLTARASGKDDISKKLTGHSDVRMLDRYRNGVDYKGLREVTDNIV